jgi:hypothetical protein
LTSLTTRNTSLASLPSSQLPTVNLSIMM